MTSGEKTSWIYQRARSLGFDLCGAVTLSLQSVPSGNNQILNELARFPEWLSRGYAGEMKYLHDTRRADPRRVLDGARSLIVVAMNYNSAPRETTATAAAKRQPRGGRPPQSAGGNTSQNAPRNGRTALTGKSGQKFSEPFKPSA